ncbi:T9SS type A sorting domain-containing protein, partial [bacterium]|nr:T9SS type A sorting domain-containing protein [bacterium]
SIFRSMTQTVPASAPAGNYTYWGHVGANPTAWSEDSFPFEKTAVDNSSSSPYQTWALTGWGDDAVSIETPSEYFLTQNYPNPFNPETTIEFGLKENSKVTLEVYNVMGQRVATLIDGYLDAGYQMVVWDASSQSSGVYFYKLHAGDFTSVKKCIIMK